jgi:hypothetical protein
VGPFVNRFLSQGAGSTCLQSRGQGIRPLSFQPQRIMDSKHACAVRPSQTSKSLESSPGSSPPRGAAGVLRGHHHQGLATPAIKAEQGARDWGTPAGQQGNELVPMHQPQLRAGRGPHARQEQQQRLPGAIPASESDKEQPLAAAAAARRQPGGMLVVDCSNSDSEDDMPLVALAQKQRLQQKRQEQEHGQCLKQLGQGSEQSGAVAAGRAVGGGGK